MKQTIIIPLILLYSTAVSAQNIGIGTPTPNNKLTVAGKMNITDSLGIGTSNPQKRLDVRGDARVNGITVGQGGTAQTLSAALGFNTLLVNGISNIQNTAVGYSVLANSIANNNTAAGANALGGNTFGNGNTGIGSNAGVTNTTGFQNTAAGYLADFGANNLTNATAIGYNAVVNTSNTLILGDVNVNVGIGTSSPASNLDVVGKTKVNGLQLSAGAGVNKILVSDAAGNASWTSFGAFETDPQFGSLTNSKVPKWGTTTLTDAQITDNGTNVGINTAVPAAKLDITGSGTGMRLLSGNISQATSYQLGRNLTDVTMGIAAVNGQFSSSSLAGDLVISTANSGQHLILNSGFAGSDLTLYNNRVGISEPAPVNSIDVNGSLAVGLNYGAAFTAPVNGAIIEGGISIANTVAINPSMFHITEPTLSKTTNSAGGKKIFTISTDDPAASKPFATSLFLNGNTDSTKRYAKWQTYEKNPDIYGGNLIFQATGGKVGVGTNAPSYTLDVNGGIRNSVSASYVVGWSNTGLVPDAVFMEAAIDVPSGWNLDNTVVTATLEDPSFQGVLTKVWDDPLFYFGKILVRITSKDLVPAGASGSVRMNVIVFHL